MPGVEVGVPWPDPSAKRLDPSAATTVADVELARVGILTWAWLVIVNEPNSVAFP